MADRQVKMSEKDKDGDILGLCWYEGSALKHVTKRDAIDHIEKKTHRYYVHEVAPPVDIKVKSRNGVKYLTTEADSTSQNNLDNLPNCTRA